jgi:hypothetical protein
MQRAGRALCSVLIAMDWPVRSLAERLGVHLPRRLIGTRDQRAIEVAVGGLAQGEEILVAAPAVSGRPHRIPIGPLFLFGIALYLAAYLLPRA